MRLEKEIETERARREEDARFDGDPLAALPGFDDERIPPEHRPTEFKARMEKLAEALERGDLARPARLGEVDCSALPCLVEMEVDVADDETRLIHDLDFSIEVDRVISAATGLGSSAASYGNPVDGRVRMVRWWPPVERGSYPTFEQRIQDAAWGRIRASKEERSILELMKEGASREEAEQARGGWDPIPGAGP